MELPTDVPVAETWRTLHGDLPPPPARLLEVGAGDGALCALIQAAGYDVTALDRSEEAAAKAAARGLRAVGRDVLDYKDDAFDIVLFGRSLHHIHPLGAAVGRAHELLRPGGTLIVEDFCFERADEPTASWLADHEAALAARGLLTEQDYWRRPDSGPLQAWSEHHRVSHDVHTGEALDRALAARFDVRERRELPYLYRYLCSRLKPAAGAADEARRVLAEERAAIASGTIRAIGCRWLALRAS